MSTIRIKVHTQLLIFLFKLNFLRIIHRKVIHAINDSIAGVCDGNNALNALKRDFYIFH